MHFLDSFIYDGHDEFRSKKKGKKKEYIFFFSEGTAPPIEGVRFTDRERFSGTSPDFQAISNARQIEEKAVNDSLYDSQMFALMRIPVARGRRVTFHSSHLNFLGEGLNDALII